MIPKPSVSPDLLMANDIGVGKNAVTGAKVSPFAGSGGPNQPLAASHSIQNASLLAGVAGGNKAPGKQLELGAPPVNARNLNVQSVMAESSPNNMIMLDGASGGPVAAGAAAASVNNNAPT